MGTVGNTGLALGPARVPEQVFLLFTPLVAETEKWFQLLLGTKLIWPGNNTVRRTSQKN